MKISLAWMLDHIATKVKHSDVAEIVAKFNMRTAEIEHYDEVKTEIKNLFVAQVIDISDSEINVDCFELKKTISMPIRSDASIGDFFLIKKEKTKFAWSLVQDFNSAKEGLFPAVDCSKSDTAGNWKKHVEEYDFILDVDNKSINHRPDLWGHRGIAREVAAFMGWKMKPLDKMLAPVKQVNFDLKSKKNKDTHLNIVIEDKVGCSRFAALYCEKSQHKPSQIWMAIRLARVDSRPINTIVDLTNYVMFDLSQPMHVFDAANFADDTLLVRRAKNKEKLELLDDQNVSLTDQDVVVTDGKKPVALAGVMGGKQASFTSDATSIIIESAAFNPTLVRESATRLKTQTEASSRFAKNLDPMQNTLALQRFLFFGYQTKVVEKVATSVVSVGQIVNPLEIKITHSYIEKKLGIEIASQKVVSILEAIDFKIKVKKLKTDIEYLVTVPTYRITKDIGIVEDIVEEVGRLYGYENISYNLPRREMSSFDMSSVETVRKVKQYCAFSMKMKEIRDYLFYDESFLRRLKWYPENAVAMKNPVSENWQVLVTSLIPNLIKNVETNIHHLDKMRFFEMNSIWKEISKKKASEHKSLAGIFFGQKENGFYDWKVEIEGFFAMLGMPVEWQKCTGSVEPWFERVQSADILLEAEVIGRCGMLSSTFMRPVGKGSGFAFEFNMTKILEFKQAKKQFSPWSKYQDVSFDVSMLIDAKITAQSIKSIILKTDKKIDKVELIDFFEKDSWGSKRSLTFRCRISAQESTLSKEQIDDVTDRVQKEIVQLGAEIR